MDIKINEQGLRVKRCPKCKIEKDETQWYFRDRAHKIFGSYCKVCDDERKRETTRQRLKDPAKRAKQNKQKRLWKYGLSEEMFIGLLNRSNNSCEICQSTKKLVIDHCHKTGKVRGVLCWSCNIALGHFQDKEEKLLKALAYLCTHKNNNQNL